MASFRYAFMKSLLQPTTGAGFFFVLNNIYKTDSLIWAIVSLKEDLAAAMQKIYYKSLTRILLHINTIVLA